MLRKTPKTERSFNTGPQLADGTALLEWFQANPGAYVRIPVVICSWSAILGERLSFIGTDPDAQATDAIALDLDDSALGIGLDSRLRSLCDSTSDACVVWIEGTWGRLLSGPSLIGDRSEQSPPWPLAVRDVGPLVEGSPTTIQVAKYVDT